MGAGTGSGAAGSAGGAAGMAAVIADRPGQQDAQGVAPDEALHDPLRFKQRIQQRH